jgi:hypothetical protein
MYIDRLVTKNEFELIDVLDSRVQRENQNTATTWEDLEKLLLSPRQGFI